MWRFSLVSAWVLIGVMLPPSALAQDTIPWDSAKTNADSVRLCPRAMTTFDAVMCQNALATQADDSLNATYAALIQAVRADAKSETELVKGHESDADSAVAGLRSAERAWIAFRQKECGWEYSWKMGTMYRPAAGWCYVALTRQRNQDLAAILRDIKSGN